MVAAPRKFMFTALCLLLFASIGMAAGSRSPLSWYNEVLQRGPVSCECPHRFLFLKGISGGRPEVWQLDIEKFQKGTFWEVIAADELDFSRKMNQSPGGDNPYPTGRKDENDIYAEVFRASFVDTILFAPAFDERWTLIRNDDKGLPQKAFTVKKPVDTSPDGLRAWLLDKLGYKGFLIDQHDNFVLVATYAPVTANANALLLSDSAAQLRVKQDDAQGGALLKLISCEESICIFEKLIDTEKKSVQGEKVVF